MNTVCEKDMCTGCTACISLCGKNAISIHKNISAYNAVINENKCVECGLCHKSCPQNIPLKKAKPIKWIQGWANTLEFREKAASGGFVTAIMCAFIKSGGVVCTCYIKNGKPYYGVFHDETEVRTLSGSKYIKSDPGNIFIQVKEILALGEKVLFVGLPCQVAGLKRFIPEKLQHNLYLVDLICHGTPSIKLYEKYMNEHKVMLSSLHSISFRTKNNRFTEEMRITPVGKEDGYTICFLKCLFFTANCYSCQFAGIERVSDLTLGDSWGSDLSQCDKDKGISLALILNEKGNEILKLADIHSENVNVEKAIANNSQLRGPAINSYSKRFFEYIREGKTVDSALFHIYPKLIIRQEIKFFIKKIVALFKKDGRAKIYYGISYTEDNQK